MLLYKFFYIIVIYDFQNLKIEKCSESTGIIFVLFLIEIFFY